jgi:hypothetical protein
MNTFIINESAITSPAIVEKRNTDTITFIATLQEADAPNRNGRIYPKSVLEEGIRAPYIQERLRTKSLISECNHPSDQTVARQMTVDLRNAACIITELWWEGNLLKGRVETANTAVGRDMKGLIEQGCQVAFSLRAQGKVQPDPATGKVIVQSPIQICTWDWVLNPSHEKAYMDRVCEQTFNNFMNLDRFSKENALCESVNIFDNGELIPINEVHIPQIVDYTTSYHKSLKPLSEYYIPEKADTVISINESENIVMIGNSDKNITKKVVLEDYIVKDIRSKIKNL